MRISDRPVALESERGTSLPRHKTPFQLRSAGSGDSEGILECLRAAFEGHRKDYTPDVFADTVLGPETIRGRLRRMRVFVALAQREVIGTVACEVNGAEGHLRGLAVFPHGREWEWPRHCCGWRKVSFEKTAARM
jgi:hypothetical protein